MRYLNWDVLLFPQESRIPIQEFKTGCYVVHDAEPLHDDLIGNGRSVRQVPILASFIANRVDGSPFRVSVHSWEHPDISNELKKLVPHGKVPCFEVRVILDGIYAAGVILRPGMAFPQIIENSIHLDKNGRKDLLRWPAFHSECLRDNYWSAGENMGRIKVTIAEGFVHSPNEGPFVRVKNIVTFSFQHAPQYIIENSGIAWPNKGMWLPEPQTGFGNISPTRVPSTLVDPDLHAHSPRRRAGSSTSSRQDFQSNMPAARDYGRYMPPPPIPAHLHAKLPAWGSQGLATTNDPFMDRRGPMRSSLSDEPMPDYITPPLSIADGTRDEIHMRRMTMLSRDSVLDESPMGHGDGLAAPANTRVSSATNTPDCQPKSAFPSEVQFPSLGMRMGDGGYSEIKIPPLRGHILEDRRVSNSSVMSALSAEADHYRLSDENARPSPRLSSNDIKMKRDFRAPDTERSQSLQRKQSNASLQSSASSEKENSTITVLPARTVSESKRKRTSAATLSTKGSTTDLTGPSPRKVSKRDLAKIQQESKNDPKDHDQSEGPRRVPLASVDVVVL